MAGTGKGSDNNLLGLWPESIEQLVSQRAGRALPLLPKLSGLLETPLYIDHWLSGRRRVTQSNWSSRPVLCDSYLWVTLLSFRMDVVTVGSNCVSWLMASSFLPSIHGSVSSPFHRGHHTQMVLLGFSIRFLWVWRHTKSPSRLPKYAWECGWAIEVHTLYNFQNPAFI